MASGNSNLVQTEQIQKLINAVQTYAHEVQEAGNHARMVDTIRLEESPCWISF